MARSYGANAQLLGKFETVYGTPPTGNYIKFPFVSCDLGSEQGLIASDLLGQGRDPSQPIRDVIRVEGNVVVPVDLRNFGHWLKAFLGAPTTTGSGPYTHTFASGAASLPSIALEVGMPDVPILLYGGWHSCELRAIELLALWGRQRDAQLYCPRRRRMRRRYGRRHADRASPSRASTSFKASIKKDGVQLGNVTGAQLTYTNNLERIETIRSDGKIDGADPTIAALTGNIEVRFADTTLIDAATDNTALELAFAYTIDADKSLTFTAHEVYLPKPKLAISGPGGVPSHL
jgi:hypothetical protein